MAESNNKFRLSKLLTDGGTYFAKELLKVEFSNAGFSDINSFLNDAVMKSKLQRLHTQPRKVLHQSQMDLLYPASGPANIDDLDITLLTCILTNCFKLSAGKQTTIADLRTLRNELFGHTASYQLDDNTFKQQWQKVASFLESESNTYLSPDCVHHINDMRKTIEGEILTHDVANKHFREMGMRHENQIHQIAAEMLTMNTKLDAMTENLKHMAKSDRKLKHEVRSYRYQKLQLFRKGLSSKHKNEESAIFEEGIGDPGLLYNDFDQQFMEAKIVEATVKIEVVKRYEKKAVDIGELMFKNKKDEFVQTLKRNRILVLVGLPGSGKTFSALSIMSELCEENVKPVVVGNLDFLRKVLDPKQNLVILVDDVLGQYALDNAVVNEWNVIADLLQEHSRSSNSYFIFTMRRSIYQSAKSNYVCESIFKNPVVIDDKTFMKENLLKLYAGTKRIALSDKQRSNILATKQFAIGFPVLCSHMDGTFETIKALFKSPLPHIQNEIQALYDNGNPQYVVILLCLMHGNKLNAQNVNKELLFAIRSSHPFFGEGDKLRDIINTLIGTFVEKVGDNISFLHNCILESTLKVGIQVSRDVMLSHLPFEYIKYLFSILKTEIGQPYKDIYKEIFPSLVEKRGNEFMKKEDSTRFLIRELAKHQSDTDGLELIVRPIFDIEQLYSNDKNVLHIAAATGKVEAIQCLLKFKPGLMQSSDGNGWNALHYAAASRSVAVVDFLIKPYLSRVGDQGETGPLINGISPEAKTLRGCNILHIAADTVKTRLVKYIMNKYKNLVFMTDKNGWNALHYASKKQSSAVVKRFLEAGLKPDTRTTDGRNILHIAASNGNMEVVRYVIENYKDLIHTVDNDGVNAFHYASGEQSLPMIKVLIEAGLKPDTRTTHGYNILHIAAGIGNMELVRYVVQNYKELIHTVDNNGWNALHEASEKQPLQMIKVLIEAGLKPDTRTTDGRNILHIAAGDGNMEVVRYVTENYKDLIHTVDNDGWNVLHYASVKQSVPMINVLIEVGLKPDTRTTDGRNILHIVASNGNMEVVRYVTESYKELIHTVDNDGWNVLHYASVKQSVPMINVLIEVGLKPDTRTTDGRNILHIVASNGNMEVVRYVTESYKELIHTVDNDGWNVLHYASVKQSVPMINVLIEVGLKPDTRTTDGRNILHIAARNGNMEVVRYVIENYKDLIHAVSNGGSNALHCVSPEQTIDFVAMLIDAGLKPETRTITGHNICNIAALYGNMEIVRYIVENYRDLIYNVDNEGMNVLHCAAYGGSVEMVKHLIEAGCDPYKKISDIPIYLQLLAFHKDFDTVHCILQDNHCYSTLRLSKDYEDFLVKPGINDEYRSMDIGNILHFAATSGNFEVVKYICEHYKTLTNTTNIYGWNALCFSSLRSSVEQFEYLISEGEEIRNTANRDNVLLLAARNGNLPIIEYIGKNLHGLLKTSNNQGETALHLAALNGSLDVFTYLIGLGEDVWKKNNDNKNVLHIAIENGRLEMVKYIGQHYPDMLTSCGRDGWTCLHHAAKYSSVSLLEYLIDAGLSTEGETLDGRNILDIAVEFGNIDLIMYIKEKGWF